MTTKKEKAGKGSSEPKSGWAEEGEQPAGALRATPPPATPPVPTPGRIVIVNHPDDGPCPAIVQSVDAEGKLRLHVFRPRGTDIVAGVEQGDGVTQWSWPVKV